MQKWTLIGAAVSLCFPLAAQAQLGFTLNPSSVTARPGSTVTFSGMLTNTGGSELFLNADVFTLSSGKLTLDDSKFFANAPASLSSGASWSGELFDVTLDPTLPLGNLYNGTFTLQGGADGVTFNSVGSANFRINASTVPAPASLLVALLGAVPAFGLLARRRR